MGFESRKKRPPYVMGCIFVYNQYFTLRARCVFYAIGVIQTLTR
jgi:hypothetical protein